MEFLGWNPENGWPLLQESYPGENQKLADEYCTTKAQYDAIIAGCKCLDFVLWENGISVCKNCGKTMKNGIHIGYVSSDSPKNFPPSLAFPYGAEVRNKKTGEVIVKAKGKA